MKQQIHIQVIQHSYNHMVVHYRELGPSSSPSGNAGTYLTSSEAFAPTAPPAHRVPYGDTWHRLAVLIVHLHGQLDGQGVSDVAGLPIAGNRNDRGGMTRADR
jgi:hypothetical protein